MLPHARLHNAFSNSLVACGLTFRAGAFGMLFLYAHKEILTEVQRGCPGDNCNGVSVFFCAKDDVTTPSEAMDSV
jgi:hypothetical protein